MQQNWESRLLKWLHCCYAIFCFSYFYWLHAISTLLPFIVSSEKTSAVIFCMLLRAIVSFVTAKCFCDHVQRAYWRACKYTQIDLLSVDEGGTVLREQVFASLTVYCAIIYLWPFACAILFGNQSCTCELKACARTWIVYIWTRLYRTQMF